MKANPGLVALASLFLLLSGSSIVLLQSRSVPGYGLMPFVAGVLVGLGVIIAAMLIFLSVKE